MTSNQIKSKDIKMRDKLGREELKEQTRSNKAREKIERDKMIMSPFNGIISGLSKIIGNHKEWYLKDEVAAKNVANLSFNLPVGTKAPTLSEHTYFQSVASVFITFANTLPQTSLSGTPADAINLAARSIYAYNRSHNSGSINYEPADYMMYLLAVGDLINLYTYLIKIARSLKGYKGSPNRLDTPKYLIEGLGYEYADFVTHEKDLYGLINALTKSIAPFAVPAGMPYYERKIWLLSNVFKQNDNDYSVFYHMMPKGFWQWKSRGVLDFKALPFSGSEWKFTALKNYVLEMINAVSLNEDFATMAGDTVKAYGDKLLRVTSVDYSTLPPLEPIYDKDALDQISSGNFVYLGANATLKICQVTDPDSNKYGVIYQGSEAKPSEGLRINTKGQTFADTYVSIEDSKEPDYIDVLRCTRFHTQLKYVAPVSDGTQLTTMITACGTEILCGLSIVGQTDDGFSTHLIGIDLDQADSTTNYFQLIRFAECLPCIPVYYLANGELNSHAVTALINGPRCRFAVTSADTLNNINVVVFDSLLNIKQFYN